MNKNLRNFWFILFLILLVLLVYSFIKKDGFKNIDNINEEILSAPQQTKSDGLPIVFDRDGYEYTLTPLFEYTLNGLVLSTQKYDTWYSLSRTDKTFTKDVCIVWGDTVRQRGYQDSTLSIKQDFRFCLYRYHANDIVFNGNELSNNHLIAGSPEIEKKILSIKGGDQIKLKGKLVNVYAKANDEISKYESGEIKWETSITREDDGAGACEVIYVEEVEILQKGNEIYHKLFIGSLVGIVLLLIFKFFIKR